MRRRLHYLADTSAMARATRPGPARVALTPLLKDGTVAVCTPVVLELLYSARKSEYDRFKELYETTIDVIPLAPDMEQRAVDVQQALARTSQHRSAGTLDLLIAACAEKMELTLLHYDRDFDAIAAVTGQPTQWIAEPGTID